LLGDFPNALAYSERAMELDERVNCTHRAPWGGADPAIVARDNVEMASRALGNLSRSLSVSEQCMAIALERGHPFSIVWASVCRIVALAGFGLYTEAVACADSAITICEKHGFDTRIGNVLFHRGPSLFELGEQERGLADLQRGVAQWRERNGLFFMARNLAKLAEYQLRANQLEQAAKTSVWPNTWSKLPGRSITLRKSLDCAAACGKQRVITNKPGSGISAPSHSHATKEPASSN
jgi:tetratricopeptide (TPR) repeat protein